LKLENYQSVSELHHGIHEAIKRIKQSNPMAAVVLLVDNPMQGLLLRRQLVNSMATKAIANLQVKTFEDLVSDLSLELGLPDCSLASDSLIDASCYAAMLNNALMQKNRAESLSTAMAIATVFKELKFITDEKLQRLAEEDFLSETQRSVIQCVFHARSVLSNQSGSPFMGNAVDEVAAKLKEVSSSPLKNAQYLIVTKTTPAALEQLLDVLPNVSCFSINRKNAEQVLTQAGGYFSVSDPQTEVQVAVGSLIQLIQAGVHPYDIAITYSDKKQYARLLATALDNSRISWHGAAETIAQASRLFQGADLIMQMLEHKTGTKSGVERPLLMRLLESGNFSINGLALDVDKCRQFVRDKEIYGDAVGWYPILQGLVKDGSKREGAAVDELKVLIKFLQKTLTSLSEANNWTEFGNVFYSALDEIYGKENLGSLGEIDADVLKKFQQICLIEFPELDALTPDGSNGLTPSANSVRVFIMRKIGDRNSRTGSLHTGVHVSGLEEVRTLKFERVIFLGATDGLLPAGVSESAFLTDEMLDSVGELGKGNIPLSEKNQQIGADFVSYLRDTQPIILRSRGAMLGKLDDIESRYLAIPKELATKVDSFESLYSFGLGLPLGNNQLSSILIRRNSDDDYSEHEQRVLKALNEFRQPKFGEYFGNLEEYAKSHGGVWEPSEKSISATSIEQFIKCRYGFFVKSVLGFYTGERKDTLDAWRSKDFGNLVHSAMENFINDLKEKDRLPQAGEVFSSADVDEFFKVYLQAQLKTFYAKGHDVWRAGFDTHMNRVTKILSHFFESEQGRLREALGLGIESSELAFGYKGTPEVLTTSIDGTPVKLNGRIDRVDLSPDGKSAGVLDFKTGSNKEYEKKIGKPLMRGVNAGKSAREFVQDLVYSVALTKIFPSVESTTVNYAFIAASGVTEYVEAKWREEPQQQLAEFLQQMIVAGGSGLFPVGHGGDVNEYSFCSACERLGTVAELVYADAFKNELQTESEGPSDE
jgi:hypothetical protein